MNKETLEVANTLDSQIDELSEAIESIAAMEESFNNCSGMSISDDSDDVSMYLSYDNATYVFGKMKDAMKSKLASHRKAFAKI